MLCKALWGSELEGKQEFSYYRGVNDPGKSWSEVGVVVVRYGEALLADSEISCSLESSEVPDGFL